MKTFLLITAILAFLAATSADECAELDEKLAKLVCDHENFDEYYKCIKDRKEVRRKRQLICPLTGMPINQVVPASVQNQPSYVQPIVTQDVVAPIITQAIAQNQNQPSYVQPIVTQDIIAPQQIPIQQLPIQQVPIQQIPIQQIPIQQVPIQQTVQSQGGSFVPRYIVQASPDFINKNVEIVGQNETLRHSQRIPAGSNVTTVFRLNNYINNTNHINVPTHINSTNINNITIFTNSSDKFGLGATTNGPCCLAVQPKRCHTTPSGPRCHHKRHKTCGSQCTSRIIHVSRSNCGHGGCDVGYVPQPSPRCVYTDYWPYVQCGHRRRDPCDGCYDYGDPYYGSPPECSGCYDDGFEYGQLYRRGPVLRPFNRPQPPCHISGTCDDDFDEGFNRDPPEVFEEEENDSEIENDLGMVLHKCKVVSDDGTVSIKNCTFNQDNNPYASAPSFGDENARRIRSHQPIMAPLMPYYSPYGYPPPYPPMYPPMPMFYPPPPPPPRSMRRYHHKHPKKEETYEPPREIPEDDEEVVEN